MCFFFAIFATGLGGCRKCVEGSKFYPQCLGPEAQPTPVNTRTITIWNLYDPIDAFKGPMQAFTSQAGPGLTIDYFSFSDEEEYEELLINELAEGRGPDIFAMHHSWLPRHAGKIAPVPTDLLLEKGYDELQPEIFRSKFFDAAAEVLIATDAASGLERVYGVPLFIDTLGLYYNTNLFRNPLYEGKFDAKKPAESWEKIKQQVVIMRERNKSIERYKLAPIAMGRVDNIRHANDIIDMLFLQHQAKLYDDTREKAIINQQQGTVAGTGKPAFPGRDALTLYMGFADEQNENVSWNQTITSKMPEAKELGPFARGITAMIFGYSRTYGDLVTLIEDMKKRNEESIQVDDIAIARAPQLNPGSDSQVALAEMYPLTVSARSANADEAWEFLAYIAGSEPAAEYHAQTKKPSARRDLNEEQLAEPIYTEIVRQVPYAKTLSVLDQKDTDAIFAKAVAFKTLFNLPVEKVLEGAELGLGCVLKKTVCNEQKSICDAHNQACAEIWKP